MIPVWFEVVSLSVLTLILIIDLLTIIKRPHIPTMREATLWVGVYVSLALVFAVMLLGVSSTTVATEFVAGWLTEYSLSVDNLFVFVLIISSFKVPKQLQQRALMFGVLVALLLRAVFIIAGAALIERFIWIFLIFGIWLIWTAWQQIKDSGEEEVNDGLLVKGIKKFLPYHENFDGGRLTTKIADKRFITPMFLVFLALGSTDLIFALDSIPAIFGITKDPFIVFTANLFALMGLRQLYFLLGGLLEKLAYLKYGIAAILAFIGVKLILHALANNNLPFIANGKPITQIPEISTNVSLIFILLAMSAATFLSVLKAKREATKSGQKLRFGALDTNPSDDES